MSVLTETPPGLAKTSDYWVDVEVPYNKIVDKWDRKYRDRLSKHQTNGRLQGKVLSIYFNAINQEIDDVEIDQPHDRSDALDRLETFNQQWAYNLCCQFEFSNGISEDVILEFAEEYEDEINSAGFDSIYDKNFGRNDNSVNKDGLVALCQLCNPDLLKDMLIYDKASSRYPKIGFKRDSGGIPSETTWASLINTLNMESVENYDKWHQFRFKGEKFVAIEEEDRDGVERQVGSNIEEEPANLIIIKFSGDYMDVYADTRSTAKKVQSGVNKDIRKSDYEEDDNPITPDKVKQFAKEISDNDKERDTDDSKSYDYVLTNIGVSQTSLPNKASLKLSAKGGVGRAVSELKALGYDILSDPQNISTLKIEYEGYTFTVRQASRNTGTGTGYRELVYGCQANPDTREEFENLMSNEFGIELKYQSST